MNKGVLRLIRAPGGLTRQFSALLCWSRAGAQALARPGLLLIFRRDAAQQQKPRHEGLNDCAWNFSWNRL